MGRISGARSRRSTPRVARTQSSAGCWRTCKGGVVVRRTRTTSSSISTTPRRMMCRHPHRRLGRAGATTKGSAALISTSPLRSPSSTLTTTPPSPSSRGQRAPQA
eukprot:Amastigsp_a515158_12.p3 type:complete len:105 gc:universal Amastigsp_a515158_12:301-615(+)